MKSRYPATAQVFESGPSLSCTGKHVEGTVNEFPGSILVRCGCIPGREWYPAHWTDVKPLTPTARDILAIAKVGAR